MNTLHDAIKALQELEGHYRELATAQWVAGDYVSEGNYNLRAQKVNHAISHLVDALKIV